MKKLLFLFLILIILSLTSCFNYKAFIPVDLSGFWTECPLDKMDKIFFLAQTPNLHLAKTKEGYKVKSGKNYDPYSTFKENIKYEKGNKVIFTREQTFTQPMFGFEKFIYVFYGEVIDSTLIHFYALDWIKTGPGISDTEKTDFDLWLRRTSLVPENITDTINEWNATVTITDTFDNFLIGQKYAINFELVQDDTFPYLSKNGTVTFTSGLNQYSYSSNFLYRDSVIEEEDGNEKMLTFHKIKMPSKEGDMMEIKIKGTSEGEITIDFQPVGNIEIRRK